MHNEDHEIGLCMNKIVQQLLIQVRLLCANGIGSCDYYIRASHIMIKPTALCPCLVDLFSCQYLAFS